MRDAPQSLWQAAAFLVLAIVLIPVSPDLAQFPRLLPCAILSVLPLACAALALRRGRPWLAMGCCILLLAAATGDGLLVFYQLLFVVTPATIGMFGLIQAYGVCALFGAAGYAAYTAARALRLDAVQQPGPEATRQAAQGEGQGQEALLAPPAVGMPTPIAEPPQGFEASAPDPARAGPPLTAG